MSTSDQQAEKAQRTQQACKRCRSRKSRCDAGRPSCSSCLTQGHDCIYDVAPRRRGPGRNKEYVRALEERLSKMESTLQHAGLSQPATTASQSQAEDAAPPTSDEDVPTNTGCPDVQPAAGISTTGTDAVEVSPPMDLLFPSVEAESELHARMPVFGAIMRWMNTPQPKFTGPTFCRRTYTAGLKRQDALTMWLPLSEHLSDTFPTLNLNCFLPRYGGHAGADDIFDSAAGWAYANVSIALGSSLKCLNESFSLLHRPIWSFFMNAFATLPELTAKGNDAMAVQAIVGMALWMQGTISLSTAVTLASAAAGMSNRLGFHRGAESKHAGGNRVQNRVFWATYILDKSISLNHGVPSMINDDGVEVDFPDAQGTDVSWFRLRSQLATVESQIARQLYTAKSLRRESGQIFQSILDCEFLLDEWRLLLPSDLADDIVDGFADEDSLDGEKLDVFLVFNSCQMLAHWAVRHREFEGAMSLCIEGARSFVGPTLNYDLPRSRHCLLRSRSAAQAVIQIFCTFQAPTFTFLWRNLCYPLCAMLFLITDILDEPATAQAIKLLRSTRSFARFLQKFERDERCSLNRVLRACATLQRTAQAAVQEAHEGATVESPPVITPGGPRSTAREDAETLHSILRSATNPMHLVQGLMGNQANRDEALYTRLAEFLGCPAHENITGIPLGPEALWPPTYGLSLAPEA